MGIAADASAELPGKLPGSGRPPEAASPEAGASSAVCCGSSAFCPSPLNWDGSKPAGGACSDPSDTSGAVRGEKPVIDEKYDILKHPNIHRTEDGGAPPYLHTPLRAFSADDLSFPIENIDDIEFLED